MAVAPAPRRPLYYQRYESSFRVGSMTAEEYAAFEQDAPIKHQFIHGEVVRVPGSSPEHNGILMDTAVAFANLLDAAQCECEVYSSDQKVYINDQLMLYPDISLVCGQPQFDHFNALRDPFVIVEVLSASSA